MSVVDKLFNDKDLALRKSLSLTQEIPKGTWHGAIAGGASALVAHKLYRRGIGRPVSSFIDMATDHGATRHFMKRHVAVLAANHLLNAGAAVAAYRGLKRHVDKSYHEAKSLSLTHELMLDLQEFKQAQGLELGLGGFVSHAINVVKAHAPRIKKVVTSVAKGKISRMPKPAKSFFSRATSVGRAAYKVAKTGGRVGLGGVKPLAQTAWKHKNAIAGVAGGAAAISALPSRQDQNPLIQSEPKLPAVKPLRYKVQ